MRITLVISSLGRGGAERVISTLANAWANRGQLVTLIVFGKSPGLEYPVDSAVTLIRLSILARSSNPIEAVFRNLRRVSVLRKAIRRSRPDVVISFVDSTNVLTLLAARGLKVPVIVSERVDPALYDIGPAWNALRRITYKWADVLVCQTRSALNRFQSTIPVEGCVIPNPVVIPRGSRESDIQRIDGITGRVLAAMGRLVPQKGFDLLLQAFAQIADHHPAWSVVIIGQGPLKAELEAQARDLNLAERVRLPGEIVDPFAAFRAADLFVLSSRFEGFANVLCEAMACGLPAVSFDCPSGPADIIRPQVDGILVPPQNVAALAAAMDRLMSSDTERTKLALRAPEVLERFGIDKVIAMWQELFDELLPPCACTEKHGDFPEAGKMRENGGHCADPKV